MDKGVSGVAVRAAVLWVVMVVAGYAAGMLFHWNVPPLKDEPLDPLLASLIVAGIGAAVMTGLAERARLRGWPLGLALFIVLYMVESGLSLIEAIAFNNDLKIGGTVLVQGAITSLLRDAAAGIAIAFLWRGETSGTPPLLRGLWWKAPVLAVLYFICYFTAGLFAYATPAAHNFYTHAPQISLAWLTELQLMRGLIWTALAFLIVRSLDGPAWQKALLTGMAFSVLMAAQLLLANPFMPWPLRCVHIVEIGVSNFVFGSLAGLILLAGAKARDL
ncbi:MAG: hypothetical protein ACXU8U_10545 [Asticcacaulis sp.]